MSDTRVATSIQIQVGQRVRVKRIQHRLTPKCPGRVGSVVAQCLFDTEFVYVRLEPTARARQYETLFQTCNLECIADIG